MLKGAKWDTRSDGAQPLQPRLLSDAAPGCAWRADCMHGNCHEDGRGQIVRGVQLAEGVGFEPTVGKPTPVFKTGTFGRSVIPPGTTLLKRLLLLMQSVTGGDVQDGLA